MGINKENILKRVELGHTYLINQIQANGKFIYQRNMDGTIKKGKYNMLRHAGCLWAINTVGNRPIENNIDGAFTYLNSKFKRFSEFLFLVDKGHTKLGGNALAILAHTQHCITESPYLIEGLVGGLKTFVYPDKLISKFEIIQDTFLETPFKSEYYPGEAALALVECGEPGAALDLIHPLYKQYECTHDHWVLQALGKLHPIYKGTRIIGKIIGDFTYKIAGTIMREEHLYAGRSCAIACRIEGMVPAYSVASNNTLKSQYAEFLTHWVDHLLAYQDMNTESVTYGAFWQDNKYRIDYTQHAICALHSYAKLLKS